ncbi:helix-turn-helix transcriptional regulator [Arenibacter sp. 6A1]|uniref:helix-turn-helix domain-containing protein n=1 Tax=Arenibacter sp. 6A1 TaxID=2720391 RepID=UPI001445BD19|nr:AraC family transcriptional regulator [Arenibacter sp. 6A1]NKI27975.1 helix-turn-helix transcriptional regulator [Arenibacter sp. 6A1]
MNSILLITAIFGFVLTSLLFFKKSTNTKATLFLGCFYFIISIYTLQTYIVEAGHLNKFSWFFLWPLTLYHLIIVPAYFYFEALIEDQFYWKKTYWLLFVPFLLGVIDVVAVYAAPSTVYGEILQGAITDTENRFRAHYWLLTLYQHYFLRHVWQCVFLLVLLPKLWAFLKEGANDRFKTTLNNWLMFFWLMLMGMSLVAMVHAIEKWMDVSIFNHFFGFENASVIITVLLYLIFFVIGVIPIYFPMILHGYPRSRKQQVIKDKPTDLDANLKFGLDETEIKEKLELLGQKKMYLDRDFTVSKFAREMEMPAHHLSYFIHQHYGLSFTTYKNNLRMEHAKCLMDNGFLEHNTMDALAEECGFASRSSFSKAFKNLMDLSPSEYVLKVRENSYNCS